MSEGFKLDQLGIARGAGCLPKPALLEELEIWKKRESDLFQVRKYTYQLKLPTSTAAGKASTTIVQWDKIHARGSIEQ